MVCLYKVQVSVYHIEIPYLVEEIPSIPASLWRYRRYTRRYTSFTVEVYSGYEQVGMWVCGGMNSVGMWRYEQRGYVELSTARVCGGMNSVGMWRYEQRGYVEV